MGSWNVAPSLLSELSELHESRGSSRRGEVSDDSASHLVLCGSSGFCKGQAMLSVGGALRLQAALQALSDCPDQIARGMSGDRSFSILARACFSCAQHPWHAESRLASGYAVDYEVRWRRLGDRRGFYTFHGVRRPVRQFDDSELSLEMRSPSKVAPLQA